MKKKIIYVPLAIDILHSAHINLLKKAKRFGYVLVGLLTDKAISEYKQLPLLNYNERYRILEGVRYIDKIVKQDTWDYTNNIKKYKPDFFIHGDDWKSGIQKNRSKVINCLKKFNGKLIEIPFTKIFLQQKLKIRY